MQKNLSYIWISTAKYETEKAIINGGTSTRGCQSYQRRESFMHKLSDLIEIFLKIKNQFWSYSIRVQFFKNLTWCF